MYKVGDGVAGNGSVVGSFVSGALGVVVAEGAAVNGFGVAVVIAANYGTRYFYCGS